MRALLAPLAFGALLAAPAAAAPPTATFPPELAASIERSMREWAEAKVKSGTPMAAVVGFLGTKGITMSPSAMKNHFSSHVD